MSGGNVALDLAELNEAIERAEHSLEHACTIAWAEAIRTYLERLHQQRHTIARPCRSEAAEKSSNRAR